MSISNRRTRFRRLGLMLFGLFVGILIAEVTLRLIDYSFPEFYVTDTSRGFALRPGASGWYTKENAVFIQINSDGLRDREHQTTKPPNTIRIAILGDSYAEGLQVPLESAFWYLMESHLNDCSPNKKRIEVINFGVSGYGTAQELLTLREHVWKYSPDIVLLAFTTSNDITDNSRILKNTDDIPYFVIHDNQLVLDASFRDTSEFQLRQSAVGGFGRWLRDRFRVVQAFIEGHRAIRIRLARWRSRHKLHPATTERQKGLSVRELGLDNLIYVEPTDQQWREGWRVTEGLIETTRNEVSAKQVRFLVVTLSNAIQVVPNPQTRSDFMKRIGATDLFYPDNRVKAFGSQKGFEVINLASALQAYAESNNVFLHGFGSDLGSGHWNEKGHQIAAELISHKLCEGSWLK